MCSVFVEIIFCKYTSVTNNVSRGTVVDGGLAVTMKRYRIGGG